MKTAELIKLVKEKIAQQQYFIDAVKPIGSQQQTLCDQARVQYNWFIEKLEQLPSKVEGEKTVEAFFEKKFGNKLTAKDSWVLRFAEEYAQQQTKAKGVSEEGGDIKWVAVKTNLPKDETKKYFVVRDDVITIEAWFFRDSKGYWYDYLGITHWAEIPRLPVF